MLRRYTLACSAGLAILLASATPTSAQNVAWIQQVKQLVASKQTYPRVAQMRGVEGSVVVKVHLDAAGLIEKIDLVKSSGSSLLDREAVSVLSKIAKLPKPPEGTQSVNLPMTWKLL